MHKPESIPENETHKILWDFELQSDHQIPARRKDLGIINKEREIVVLWILRSQQTKVKIIKIEKRNKYLDLARELKKLWIMRVTVITIVIDSLGSVLGLKRAFEELEIGGWIETI